MSIVSKRRKRPLLLGVGNILLHDEGVGVRVVEEFARRHPELAGSDGDAVIDVIDGGTAGMELLDDIADRPLVVIVDAMKSGDSPPGTIRWLARDEVPLFFARKLSPHQLGLSDLLSALVMTGEFPERIFLLGIVPESIEPGIGLTETIAGKMKELQNRLEVFLREENILR